MLLLLFSLIAPVARSAPNRAAGADESDHAAMAIDDASPDATSSGITSPAPASPEAAPRIADAIEIAQAEEAEEARDSRPLEPRYQPREPKKKSWYNGSYIFGMTRGVASSTIAPAGKVPLFVLTVPLDLAFLPFAAIGGLFG
jgi:hypothetical protein